MTVPSLIVASGTVGSDSVAVNGNVVTITLTGVPNAQTVTLRFGGVTDGVNTGTFDLPIGFLVADTNGSRSVSAADVGQTKAQSGNATNGGNFRTDVNLSGSVSAADVGLVKSRSGTALPP